MAWLRRLLTISQRQSGIMHIGASTIVFCMLKCRWWLLLASHSTLHLSSSSGPGIFSFLLEKCILSFGVKGLRRVVWNLLLIVLSSGKSEESSVTSWWWGSHVNSLKKDVHFGDRVHSLNMSADRFLVQVWAYLVPLCTWLVRCTCWFAGFDCP